MRTEADARAAACATAKADVAQAQARVDVVGTARQRTVLVAPFDGTVAQIVGEVGEYSTPSPPGVATPPAIDLIDESCLYVSAPMDEVDAPKIDAGQPVRITLDALPGKSFAGKVRRIAPYVHRGREAGAHGRDRGRVRRPEVRRAAARGLQRRRRGDPRIAPRRAARADLGAAAGRPRARCSTAAGSRSATVKTGVANWEHTEITEGLAAGDQSSPRSTAPASRPAPPLVVEDSPRAAEVTSDGGAAPGSRERRAAAQIELAGIERVFHLGDSTVRALADVDLRIAPGEYIAVMGPSGSGKSTLLNVLGLLDRPDAGHYLLEGRDVTTLSPDEQARVRSHRIGFVFQSFHLVPRLTAAENVALPMMLAGMPARERDERVREALAGFGLADRADHRPTSSRAASASAWRSRARRSCSPRCCSPTSRPATSTAPPARRSSACSSSSTQAA